CVGSTHGGVAVAIVVQDLAPFPQTPDGVGDGVSERHGVAGEGAVLEPAMVILFAARPVEVRAGDPFPPGVAGALPGLCAGPGPARVVDVRDAVEVVRMARPAAFVVGCPLA